LTFNLGERIKQVRAIEAKIDAMQAEFDTKLKPYEDFATKGRAEILQFLNATNQKSANTEFGGAYWTAKVTYRVEDKDTFRRHVIGAEAWELITWAAMPTNCELFIAEHKMPPPGLQRSVVNVLHVTVPTKPKKKKVIQDGGQDQPEQPEPEQQAAE
jgi:hypothetical protein